MHQHLKNVEKYSDEANYASLSYEDTLIIADELAPLIAPDEDEPKAVRFDALMYGIELAYLAGKTYSRAKNDLLKKAAAIAGIANIPEITAQKELLDSILHSNYLENAGINEFEHIREKLRDLVKYIPHESHVYDTDFADQILSMD